MGGCTEYGRDNIGARSGQSRDKMEITMAKSNQNHVSLLVFIYSNQNTFLHTNVCYIQK